MISSFALGFLLTQAVETPLYVWAKQRFFVALGASCLTHPVIWFWLPHIVPQPWYVPVAEAFAVVAEGFYLKAFGAKRPFLLSLAANSASFLLGCAIFGLPF